MDPCKFHPERHARSFSPQFSKNVSKNLTWSSELFWTCAAIFTSATLFEDEFIKDKVLSAALF
jgi:hypothetical protein